MSERGVVFRDEAAARLLQAILRTCITTTIRISSGRQALESTSTASLKPNRSLSHEGTEKSNGGAEDAAGLVQEAATHALQMPDHADQLSHNDDQMQLRWPRRLGSAFRVSVACAKRLQGVLRRYDARTRHREASSATRNLLQYCVRRAVVERKYRFALRRDALQLHVPTVVRGSLFLREEEMDRVDRARYAQLLSKRLELEVLYQKMRSNQNVLAKTEKDYKEIVEYEDKLYKDLTRGGGGGLVRKLGGQKAATKALEDAQASLALLTSLRLSQKEAVSRIEKDIKWMFEGSFDSLVSCEEFVQDGHVRCCPGEYVTIADRYKEDARFVEMSKRVGKLSHRHSNGSWWVHFEHNNTKGILHLKYATGKEMQQTMHAVQLQNKEERLAAEAAKSARILTERMSKGPSSLNYNRNPVVCYYNVPVTEFATSSDLRYAARVVNHAACLDPRDRIWSNVVANAIKPSCWGKEPFTFTWEPVPPATHPPLGLEIDLRTGTVTGTPHFLGTVSVHVKCTDADGFSSKTQLRFCCEKLAADAIMPRAPRLGDTSPAMKR